MLEHDTPRNNLFLLIKAKSVGIGNKGAIDLSIHLSNKSWYEVLYEVLYEIHMSFTYFIFLSKTSKYKQNIPTTSVFSTALFISHL